MDTDLVLTIGVILGALSVPSLLAAWAESRAPRIGAIMIIAAMAMIVTASLRHPGGYGITSVPYVMLDVFARLIG